MATCSRKLVNSFWASPRWNPANSSPLLYAHQAKPNAASTKGTVRLQRKYHGICGRTASLGAEILKLRLTRRHILWQQRHVVKRGSFRHPEHDIHVLHRLPGRTLDQVVN